MKKLLLILILLFTACNILETFDGICYKVYNIPKWNMVCQNQLVRVLIDADIENINDVQVKIFSDSHDTLDFYNFEMHDSTIILTVPIEFQTEEFDDFIERGEIYLIYYTKD